MLDVKGLMFIYNGKEQAFFRNDYIYFSLTRDIIEQKYILDVETDCDAMLSIDFDVVEVRCQSRDIVMELKDFYWIADDGFKAEVDLLVYRPKT